MMNGRSGGSVSGPEVLALLTRQVAVYEQLQSLAEKQKALITCEDTQPLLRVLAHRKRLTAELTRINDRMAPFRDQWPRVRSALAEAERVAVDGLIGQASSRLKRLITEDEQDARMLKLRLQRVGAELGAIRSKKGALAAYRRACTPTAARFDKTHDEA